MFKDRVKKSLIQYNCDLSSILVILSVILSYIIPTFTVQFSGEELSELKGGAWENPAFDNMDQLMDERSPNTLTHTLTHTHTHTHTPAGLVTTLTMCVLVVYESVCCCQLQVQFPGLHRVQQLREC